MGRASTRSGTPSRPACSPPAGTADQVQRVARPSLRCVHPRAPTFTCSTPGELGGPLEPLRVKKRSRERPDTAANLDRSESQELAA